MMPAASDCGVGGPAKPLVRIGAQLSLDDDREHGRVTATKQHDEIGIVLGRGDDREIALEGLEGESLGAERRSSIGNEEPEQIGSDAQEVHECLVQQTG